MDTRQKIYRLLAQGKKTKEISATLDIKLRTVQYYAQEYKNAEKENANKVQSAMERKLKKEVAKAQIEVGASIKETAERIGVPESTVANWSVKHKLQQKQADFLKQLAEEETERIKANKKKRLEINTNILETIEEEVKDGKFNGHLAKSTVEKLKLTEEIEQSILEKDRLDRLDRLEWEKEKYKREQIIAIVEELKSLDDDELKEIQEILRKRKEQL